MKRRESLKQQATRKTDELQWDFIDRCFLPIIFSHALAVAIAFILQTLRISQVSTFSLFLLFVLLSVGFTICYHNLQVRSLHPGTLPAIICYTCGLYPWSLSSAADL